jgi:exosortase K
MNRLWAFVIQKGVFYVLGFFIALALKYHYSQAGSDGLGWILSPTTTVVEYLTGIHFEKEAHAGFMSKGYGIIIAPSCAGVNFLIIAFCTLYFSMVGRLMGMTRQFLWLGIAAAIAYLFTLGVNSLRIIAAIFLYRADIYGGWITPERLHRIEGTFIYFFFLLAVYPVGRRIAHWLTHCLADHGKMPTVSKASLSSLVFTCAIPLFWYSLITIGVPLLNHAYRHHGPKFVDHCTLVISVCLIAIFVYFLMMLGWHKLGFTAEFKGR